MVVIVDYGMGNLMSVDKAVEHLGRRAKVTDSKQAIKKAKKIIFPGVGHFGRAVKELKKRGIYSLLKERIQEGVPFLGICLGMQLLFEESQEAPAVKGLSIIRGKVCKFNEHSLIVPHMGWNRVKFKVLRPERIRLGRKSSKLEGSNLFRGIEDRSFFYFAHSYYCHPKEEVILSVTDYGKDFVSSLHKNNVWAVQFHPEKSQELGLKLLSNFLNSG